MVTDKSDDFASMEAALVEPKHPRVKGRPSAAEDAFIHLLNLLVGSPNVRPSDNGTFVIVRHDPRRFVEETLDAVGVRYHSEERDVLDLKGGDPFHDAKGWATITIDPTKQDPGFVERVINAVEQISPGTRNYTEQTLAQAGRGR